MLRRFFVAAGASVLVAGATAVPGQAAEPSTVPGPSAERRAYVDPETGELRPPAPAEKAERAQAQRNAIAGEDSEPPRARRREDGVLILPLGPSSRVYERVEIGDNGQLEAADDE